MTIRVVRWVLVFTVVLSVLSSGCLGSSGQNGSSTPSSTIAPLTFPDNVSFRASLKVFEGSKIVTNYSYQGSIDYISKSAVISLRVIYNPENKQLTGNWHYKKIVIDNGTSVRVFNVPPASWTEVPQNKSEAMISEVFSQNPYRYLFKVVNGYENVPDNGNFSIEISADKSRELLAPLMWGNAPPDVPLKGWVIIQGGKVRSAHLEGVSGNKRYVFNLEVSG